MSLNSVNIKWFVPSETEIALVESIFWKYLIPELETIDKYIDGKIELSRYADVELKIAYLKTVETNSHFASQRKFEMHVDYNILIIFLRHSISSVERRTTMESVSLSITARKYILNSFNFEILFSSHDYLLPIPPMTLNTGVKRYINMPDGSNVYKVLIEKMAKLQTKLLKDTDDTTAFLLLINVGEQ